MKGRKGKTNIIFVAHSYATPTTIRYPSGIAAYIVLDITYTFDTPEPCENIRKSHESCVTVFVCNILNNNLFSIFGKMAKKTRARLSAIENNEFQ